MIKRLIKLANYLDSKGLVEEANDVDAIIRLAAERTQEEIDDLQGDPSEWENLFTGKTRKEEIDEERYDELLKQLEQKGKLESFLSYVDKKTELGLKGRLSQAEGWDVPFPWGPEEPYYESPMPEVFSNDELRDCMAKKWKQQDSDLMAASGGRSYLDLDPTQAEDLLMSYREDCEREFAAAEGIEITPLPEVLHAPERVKYNWER